MDRISSLAVGLGEMQGMLAGSFHRKLPGTAAVFVFQGALSAQTYGTVGHALMQPVKLFLQNCEKIFFTFIYSAKKLFTNKNYVENGLIKSNFILCCMF
jgi:hypothetical protein